MKISIKDLTSSNNPNVGKEFWICDYRFRDITDKAIRNVHPTKAILVNKQEGERVYYSETYFVDAAKKSKKIKLFDNTGFRSYAGEPLHVFDNEQECMLFFADQCRVIEKAYKDYMTDIVQSMGEKRDEVTALIIKYGK